MRYAALALTGTLVLSLPLAAPARGQTTPAPKGEQSLPQPELDPRANTLAWKTVAPSPFARVEAPSVAVNGKLYLFGGFTSELKASPEVDIYDPATDVWTRLKDMPTGVTHLNPEIDGNTIWFAGGFKGKHPGPASDEVWKYDVAMDTWSPGPSLPDRRGAGALAVVGRQLHYFGGYLPDRNSNSADHWVLSLEAGGTWRREADLPDPRGHVSSAVLNGRIYALGGADGHDIKQTDVKSCHVYDPATSKWSAIASLPDGRSHFESSTIVHNGRIIVVGGRCNSSTPPRNVVNDLIVYDPTTDNWSVLGSMPQGLMAPSAAIFDGRIVVTCGGLNNPRPLVATTRVAALPPVH